MAQACAYLCHHGLFGFWWFWWIRWIRWIESNRRETQM